LIRQFICLFTDYLTDKLVIKLIAVSCLGTSQPSRMLASKQRSWFKTSLFRQFDLLKSISVLYASRGQ